MKKCLVLILIITTIFFGCSYVSWKHPTKPDSQWAVDHADCEKQIREIIREKPELYSPIDEVTMIKECMKKKGWRK
ncbi:MAG: hypothetical protein K9L30_12540 [Desulfobacterales bacterium]|nr:hypothetical protein [Desulfobacterales bacterium]